MLAPAACEYASALGKEAARLLPLRTSPEQPRAAPTPVTIRRPSVQLDDSRLLALRSLSASGAEGLAWHDAILREAGALLRAPLLERRFEPRRPVLLPTSRAALARLRLLGIAHMLSGDDDYVARAVAEIEVVCAFPDWNPSHFLDVAEMAHGVALAYDWMHQRLAPELRQAVRTALVEKALRPGLEQFARGTFWTKASHNWNTVCNAGLAIAALAVRDDEPDLAQQVLDRTLRSVALSFASFAPDGGWIEGVTYWDYATRYAVDLLDALATAGVPDRGLAQAPGFAATGRFALHMTGPSGRVYNFADSSERLGRLAQLHWLGARFGRPIDAHVARARPGAPQPMELVWRAAAPGIAPAAAGEPLDALFAGVQVASFRSAWDDPAGVWLACKGGDNAANHAHLDLGSFVVEAAGERWAIDLGPSDYALPGYFDRRRRFAYLRTGSAGHSVLRVDGADQALDARGTIVASGSTPAFAHAVADLSSAYPGIAHHRGWALIDRRTIAIVDEVTLKKPQLLSWQMLTAARADADGPTAQLVQNGKRLNCRLVAPADGRFAIEAPRAAEGEAPARGVTRLVAHLQGLPGPNRIAVLLSLDAAVPGGVVDRAMRPLAAWGA